jgi:Sec-independent protein secretion pathway component TatC
MIPLLLLYELSIILARAFGGSRDPVERVASAEGS